MKLSILGTGKMGAAVGRKLAEGGSTVVFGSRSPLDNQAKFADCPNISVGTYLPMDCGALSNSRYLEAMAMLWLQLAFWEDQGDAWAFKIAGRWGNR